MTPVHPAFYPRETDTNPPDCAVVLTTHRCSAPRSRHLGPPAASNRKINRMLGPSSAPPPPLAFRPEKSSLFFFFFFRSWGPSPMARVPDLSPSKGEGLKARKKLQNESSIILPTQQPSQAIAFQLCLCKIAATRSQQATIPPHTFSLRSRSAASERAR